MKQTVFISMMILLGPSWWGALFAATEAPKKVFYVNSYHEGYDWSDGIRQGIQESLAGEDVELKIFNMDTKRHPADEYKTAAGLRAKEAIDAFKPDVLIVSDDNAFKHVVMPYYRDVDLPVVFCGLNWDAAIYGAPYQNTTGMIEVALIPELLDHLRQYAKGDRIGYLEADVLTARKEAANIMKRYGVSLKERYVKTLGKWKSAFVDLQGACDILILGNNAGIADWNDSEAKRFAEANTKIPTGAIYAWMMPYTLLGVTKVEKEQGTWAGRAALKLLKGTPPTDIPVVTNREGNLMVNLAIADKLGVIFTLSTIRNAVILDKE